MSLILKNRVPYWPGIGKLRFPAFRSLVQKGLLWSLCFVSLMLLGCAKSHQIITSDPPWADIYWGKTQNSLVKSTYMTPYSDTITGKKWEPWCYQVMKNGYHDSEIICREVETYRKIHFNLSPVKTTITSEPESAIIYWGPSKDQMYLTGHMTPHTETDVSMGASWKDWYFQVKKEGYLDSEVIFLPRASNDRDIHFTLRTRN
jgi:hypothetical protein